MSKIYLTYGTETREGFESRLPCYLFDLPDESVDEIAGEQVLEKIPDLVRFVEALYRVLKKDAIANFSSNHFANSKAWTSPLVVRGISEHTMNFASKAWREQYKYTEVIMRANFEVKGQFAVEEKCLARADEVRAFWMEKYLNVVQAVLFTLTKLEQ